MYPEGARIQERTLRTYHKGAWGSRREFWACLRGLESHCENTCKTQGGDWLVGMSYQYSDESAIKIHIG